ncbi:acyltransferase family protein [Demequina rhizosphaerae]|uniref:acyltransferase family protein n=1 Tax=Demequina rhizosphaerae TaxID=1638985 RepID=UPI000784FC5B|nr:acyltransferase [Demequina rhizosphaerae]
MGTRDKNVDSLRGIACILLVTVHVVHSTAVPNGWALWYGDAFIGIRMPLFAFLSGVVYAWRPVTSPGLWPSFIANKARRLLIPYVILVPILAISHLVLEIGAAPSANPVGWFLFPQSPYWFLLASFWVYAAVALADSHRLLERRRNVAWLFAALLALNVVVNLHAGSHPPFLRLTSALYLALYFVAGMAAIRFGWRYVSRRVALGTAALFLALFLYVQAIPLGAWTFHDNPRQDLVQIALAISFPLAFMALRLQSSALAWIGGYSAGIYLLHPFTMVTGRAILHLVGVESTAVDVLFTSAVSLFGAVLGVTVMRRFALGRVTLGERVKVPARIVRRDDA